MFLGKSLSSLKSLNKEFKGVGNDLLHECWIVPSVLITLGPIAPIFSLHSILVKRFERISYLFNSWDQGIGAVNNLHNPKMG